MAALLHVSQASLSEWANYKKQVPWDKLALAKELSGKSWDWILGATDADAGGEEVTLANPATIAQDMPASNARLPKNIDDTTPARNYFTPGAAAAYTATATIHGGFSDDTEEMWDDITIPERTHFIQIIGDSMAPLVLDRQYVAVGPEYIPGDYKTPQDREVVVVSVFIRYDEYGESDESHEGVYCKRIHNDGDKWHFTSINPTGESFTVHKANCRIRPVLGVWFAGQGRPPFED